MVEQPAAIGRVITGVTAQLREVRDERAALAVELEARLEAHPPAEVLTSMPGVGVRAAIKILTIVGDGSAFVSAAHLASYAGLAPVTHRSGSSDKGESHSQRGHHALKSCCSCPRSRHCQTRPAAPMTTANGPRDAATTLP